MIRRCMGGHPTWLVLARAATGAREPAMRMRSKRLREDESIRSWCCIEHGRIIAREKVPQSAVVIPHCSRCFVLFVVVDGQPLDDDLIFSESHPKELTPCALVAAPHFISAAQVELGHDPLDAVRIAAGHSQPV